ncbi:MAG: glycosyltransferase family 2 protein [Hyphomonadaceae bacterium]|nr:glycosyltransferase family 2 protein [Hyphomonadaceae bacterium]
MAAREISVIVPTFGRAEAVVRAVDSVLAQDADLEVVVVDDASPAPIVIDRERTRVLRLDRNAGAAGARNAGVAAATSEWIALLDSDDVWEPRSLAPRLAQARAKKDVSHTIWCAAFISVWPGRQSPVRIPRASDDIADFASGCWTCPGSTALMNRVAWDRSGGQDEALRRLEDYDWLLRWSQSGGQIEVHEGAAARVTRGARGAPTETLAAAEHIRRKQAALAAPLKKRMESYLSLELAVAHLGAGDMAQGVAELMRSWMLHPRLQPSLEPFWRTE